MSYFKDVQEKAISWIWVILFISSILYLRGLLVDMHSETNRLSDERQRFQVEMEIERERSKENYREFYADINETIQRMVESINKGGVPYKYLNP